jgi:hypothetical protein
MLSLKQIKGPLLRLKKREIFYIFIIGLLDLDSLVVMAEQ